MADAGDENAKEIVKKNINNQQKNSYYLYVCSRDRVNPFLIKAVEDLKKEASGSHANLIIEEINSKKYRIVEYDGNEYIETPESIEWINI